jgi:hypothetical protein
LRFFLPREFVQLREFLIVLPDFEIQNVEMFGGASALTADFLDRLTISLSVKFYGEVVAAVLPNISADCSNRSWNTAK